MTEGRPLEDRVLESLTAWGRGRPEVRALVLTSTRAREGGVADDLSDYDVIVAVVEPESFVRDDAWQRGLGRPLVRWGDQDEFGGRTTFFRGVVYEDLVKIDFTIWPSELLEHVARLDALPDELDAGYLVLLDKYGPTARWNPPTHRAFIPAPPTAEEYRALVEEFWWDVTYAVKALWRGEVIFAKSFVLEHDMRLEALNQLLGWRIEIVNDWSVPLGRYGRGLERLLPADIWSEVEATFVGPDLEESWDALFRMMDQFGRVARDVGEALGYPYPEEIEDRISAHARGVRARPRAVT